MYIFCYFLSLKVIRIQELWERTLRCPALVSKSSLNPYFWGLLRLPSVCIFWTRHHRNLKSQMTFSFSDWSVLTWSYLGLIVDVLSHLKLVFTQSCKFHRSFCSELSGIHLLSDCTDDMEFYVKGIQTSPGCVRLPMGKIDKSFITRALGTPPAPPSYKDITRKEILNCGIDNKSGSGPFKVFHQMWLTLALTCYCVLRKKMLKGPQELKRHLWSFILLNWHWGVPEPNHSNKPLTDTHTHTHTQTHTCTKTHTHRHPHHHKTGCKPIIYQRLTGRFSHRHWRWRPTRLLINCYHPDSFTITDRERGPVWAGSLVENFT